MDLWVTTRPTKDSAWQAPVNLGSTINTWADETAPSITNDGLELYFSEWKIFRSGGCGGQDIWVTTRPTTEQPWGEPVNLGPAVNTPNHEGKPAIAPDGLTLFFTCVGGSEGSGSGDIWMTTRSLGHGEWGSPVNLGPPINTADYEDRACISADGSTLYFIRQDTGTWEVPIIPVPIIDFNGDGKANGRDAVILAEHWGQSDPVCDVGPYAWGDGIVNEQDLFMLAEYLEKEFVDPTLVAHWALDETEGIVAADSAGGNDAMVMGDPAWQPEGGSVGGALAFDGVDDCIVTDPVAELSAGSFSILAWVKGGAADEVILSSTPIRPTAV